MSMQFMIVAVGDVTPSARNARTHSSTQIDQIAASIQTFGFTNPILVDESLGLIAGHGRLDAAKSIGLETVPAIQITHLSDAQKRALMLADNKIALNAGWDLELLAEELADLSSMNLGFELNVTGFEVPETDLIIEQAAGSQAKPETAPEPDRSVPSISRRGDVWTLGRHRLMCGDARTADDVGLLMEGAKADVGFSDPPYNVPINGHVSGKGKVRHREFAEASGEMNEAEFTTFLSEAFGLAAQHSRDGAVWFACMDWRHIAEMQAAGRAAFGTMLNLCVWAKTNGGMGSLYRSQHELVFVFKVGDAPHRNNVELGRHGRNRTNLWTYAGVNTFRRGRMEDLRAHPTAKPVAMIKDALLDVSRRGDIVLDPFLGAGATLIAAERCGRDARGMDIDPAYVDVALRRWREETGDEPVRVSDGCQLQHLEDMQ
ncbi:DNA methyltransferase [Aestuariicoccus sp. MJ-SS9]|uniref:site-specific DNA-methyltransferase n=1 Tax=Aestuariicoccus sp. MJ-SS9 TaxID=3079855 RepID=UPI002910732C|nr:DNA methyltransferase [Aestuariicoccus sp. MJ-SS9]MDU8912247.1 DNA methyltransferase [Aestuariicoccus sp. MJ-SS9]